MKFWFVLNNIIISFKLNHTNFLIQDLTKQSFGMKF